MIPRIPLLIMVGLVLASAGLSAVYHGRLPDTVPTHWSLDGEPDEFGSKLELLLLMPGLLVMIVLLFHFLPLIGPFRQNIEWFQPIYGRVCVAAALLFVAIHFLLLRKADGDMLDFMTWFSVVLGGFLMVMGNWFGKLRRNFYVGIRTPWTISNDVVWERTHRLGGRLFVAFGAVLIGMAFIISGRSLNFFLLGGIGIIAIWVSIYSLVVYRREGATENL